MLPLQLGAGTGVACHSATLIMLILLCRLSFSVAYSDVIAVRVGGSAWRFTKRHWAFERDTGRHAAKQLQLQRLLDPLLSCLVLALPRGIGAVASAAGGEAPPAKAARRSARIAQHSLK